MGGIVPRKKKRGGPITSKEKEKARKTSAKGKKAFGGIVEKGGINLLDQRVLGKTDTRYVSSRPERKKVTIQGKGVALS